MQRAMISAALKGQLQGVEYQSHPVFGLLMPKTCPGVPSEILDPSKTWADTKAYDKAALALAQKFKENFSLYENKHMEHAF